MLFQSRDLILNNSLSFEEAKNVWDKYSAQKKKLSAKKQVQDFPNMMKIQNLMGPILNYFAYFGVESFFFFSTVYTRDFVAHWLPTKISKLSEL